ncbi:MAG: PD-(D/E)XK motif protein [Sulfurospirillum sp.]|nr:PD-(D/E)XK motif protein [Sulfurospirillum sp.]
MMINPWKDMKKSTQRRVKENINHDIFWIIDLEGKYGLYIKIKSIYDNNIDILKLKGLSILKRNEENTTELFIALNSNQDWEIFLTLCKDLILIAKKYSDDITMFNAIENRLKRWQQFLLKNKSIDFPLHKQMGLFSELMCLKEIIANNIGIKNAIYSWVGADFDKQDFLLEDMIIEVKSYKTSKTPIVSISSAAQLYSDKQPIYLISYGLTPTDNGISIDDLILDIEKQIENESFEFFEIFHNKLFEYGYMIDLDIKKYKFIIDKNRIFHVSTLFPKITPLDIDSRILNLNYSIDLLQCKEFEIERIQFKGR